MTAPPEHIALSSSLAAQMATLQPAAGTATDYSAPLVDNAALPMRMMEALDKYAAMKAAQTGGGVSGAY